MNEAFAAKLELDITHEICPMTFVRVRLALDRLAPGEVLLVRLRGEEPAYNVPATATAQGHTVLRQQPGPDGTLTLWIAKRGPVSSPSVHKPGRD